MTKEPPSARKWRTLLTIESVRKGAVTIALPGWELGTTVTISLDDFPEALREHVKPHAPFFARVNLAADRVEDVTFEDWEYHGPFNRRRGWKARITDNAGWACDWMGVIARSRGQARKFAARELDTDFTNITVRRAPELDWCPVVPPGEPTQEMYRKSGWVFPSEGDE